MLIEYVRRIKNELKRLQKLPSSVESNLLRFIMHSVWQISNRSKAELIALNLREKLTNRYKEMKKRSELHQFNDEVKVLNQGSSIEKIQHQASHKVRIMKSLTNA